MASPRGAVIILVLVTVVLAASLLAAFIHRSGADLLADARAAAKRELRAEAFSALETMLAIVAAQRAADGGLPAPDPAWPGRLAVAGYQPPAGFTLEMSIEDESGKIPFTQAQPAWLQSSMETAGLDPATAARLSRAIVAWMHSAGDERYEPEAPDYSRHSPAYRPPQRPLLGWRELGAIEMGRGTFFDEFGRPTPVTGALRDDFSLHDFTRINLNTASSRVLGLLGMEPARARAMADWREQQMNAGLPGYVRSSAELASVVGPVVVPAQAGFNVAALRITVRVWRGAIGHGLTVVVMPADGEVARNKLDYPFTVVEINEEALLSPTPSA
ncbi:MAG: general secretion pathway protein GspK [Opitutaceae bacterium]|nr:general secretion pathway protein GspK [Opitutaceae bacterium]